MTCKCECVQISVGSRLHTAVVVEGDDLDKQHRGLMASWAPRHYLVWASSIFLCTSSGLCASNIID
jgi:hypothetical protein